MAKRAGATITTIPAAHGVGPTRPDAVNKVILDAVASVR